MFRRLSTFAMISVIAAGLGGIAQAQDGRWRHDRDNDDWRQGPYQGYGYPYPNNAPYPGNYPYGQYRRGSYGNQAYNQGLRDGTFDGRNDRATGHSYRPTHDSNYKHADRGYASAYGDKNSYKQQYRSGYVAGYERGYGRY